MITVSESDTNPVMLCVELDLTSAGGTSLGCDLTVTISILDGTNAGIHINAVNINTYFPTTHK